MISSINDTIDVHNHMQRFSLELDVLYGTFSQSESVSYSYFLNDARQYP
jgi:hypothetical protein